MLLRHDDPTGVSGTGVVAHGVEFRDGTVAVHWHGDYPCTQVWHDVNHVRVIHGHAGRTVVRWLDPFARGEDPYD